MKERSLRRHHKERMKNKAKILMKDIRHDKYYIENPDKLEEFANTHADNLKKCSCWMCKNPRRIFKDNKPIQEKKEEAKTDVID